MRSFHWNSGLPLGAQSDQASGEKIADSHSGRKGSAGGFRQRRNNCRYSRKSRVVKNPKLQTGLVLTLVFAALWGLLVWDPFRHLRDVFVNPVQEQAKVSVLFTDPNTQEISDGEH